MSTSQECCPVGYRLLQLGHSTVDGEQLDALAKLTITCLNETYSDIVPPQVLGGETFDIRKAAWVKLLEDETNYCAAIARSNELVGFVAGGVRSVAPSFSHIYSLYVLRNHKRLGLGRLLFCSALSHFEKLGGKVTTVGVLKSNVQAVDFYKKAGGRLFRETKYDWSGVIMDQLIFAYDLPQQSSHVFKA